MASPVALPSLVGKAELLDGSKFEIRKKECINFVGNRMYSYELWTPYHPRYDILGDTSWMIQGCIELTELDSSQKDDVIEKNLPSSYLGKKMTYINSLKSWAGKKGAGSTLIKIAVLHSKSAKDHEGKIFLKSTNGSNGFYAKLGLRTIDPTVNEQILEDMNAQPGSKKHYVDCVYMHLPAEKIDLLARGKIKSLEFNGSSVEV